MPPPGGHEHCRAGLQVATCRAQQAAEKVPISEVAAALRRHNSNSRNASMAA